MEWYPLYFEPILKKVLWGGSSLAAFKQMDFDSRQVGESWDLSAVEGSVSVLSRGPLKGKSLNDLISLDPAGLLGSKVYERYGEIFPLLFKWIDTAADLSIQVHPDDVFAQAQGKSFGKTELWYVVDSEPAASLISGFNKAINREEYLRRIRDNSIEEVLLLHAVKSGDVFLIPPGRVHSIGKGILLAEIQQSSDITYRIYDFQRKDSEGKTRPLHTELAAQCLDYTLYSNYTMEYSKHRNKPVSLTKNKHFHVNRLELGDSEQVPEAASGNSRRIKELECHPGGGSFIVYMCLQGELDIYCANGSSGSLSRGRTVLIPAAIAPCRLQCKQHALVLESYIEV